MPEFLSVIAPFAGGPTLPRFLASLSRQSLPAERFELILAAEGAPDAELAVAAARLPCAARVLRWSRPHDFIGHSAGILRNRAATLAKGELLVFLDADVVLHRDCLLHHARRHAAGERVALAGAAHELPIENQPRAEADFAFDEALAATLPDFRLGTTGTETSDPDWARWFSLNASVARAAFEAAGGFSERGYRCHDLELAYRLAKLGLGFAFAPEAEVIHLQHPRSLRTHADQIHGWIDFARAHPEMQAYAEDRIRLTQRALRAVTAEAESRFAAITAGLPGYRADCAWICPPGTDRGEIDRRLAYHAHAAHEAAGGIRLQLGLHAKCWDYSIDVPSRDCVREPLLSIVCPVFNDSATLPRAIQSVLAQSLLAWELILVDDASTDASAALASRYLCDPRIRLVSLRHNRGLSHALNAGLTLARAPLLVQLDADDALAPDALARIAGCFARHPETVALYGDPWVHDAEGNVWTHRGRQLGAPAEYFEYREYQAPRAYRAASLKEIGGWRISDAHEGRYYDDRLVLARLAESGSVRWVEDKLYHIYEREGSLSRGRRSRFAAAKYAISCDQANRRGRRFRRVSGYRHLWGAFDPRPAGPPRRSWSVVIPFCRSPEHLFHSLRSWLESDLVAGEHEILVVGPRPAEMGGRGFPGTEQGVRFVATESIEPAARARNRGARLARGEMLFFSDEDHIVPPDVIACHEARHRELDGAGVVVGNVFGRRGALVLAPEDRPEHKRRILEGLRWHADFAEIAARLATGRLAPLPSRGRGGIWHAVGEAAFTETWMRGWGEILLEFGEQLQTYPHRWTRVTSGSLSIPAALFGAIGGFGEEMESHEDWELGARLQRRGAGIVCAPEAEPYHLIHPAFAERPDRDLRAYLRLKQSHPDLIAAILAEESERGGPARSAFRRFEERLAGAGDARAPADAPRPRLCSLTFDDGPHPLGTPAVLDLLRSFGATATFFCLGEAAQKYPHLVAAAAADGHEIGIHGGTHSRVDAMTSSELRRDIEATRDALERLSGKPARFIRPPYGEASAAFLEVSRQLGLEIVGWHASAGDWLALAPEEIMLNLAWQGIVGKVVLLHDGCGDPDGTAEALRWLLEACRRSECAVVGLDGFSRAVPLPGLAALPVERWSALSAW